jgi:hypothetical protein
MKNFEINEFEDFFSEGFPKSNRSVNFKFQQLLIFFTTDFLFFCGGMGGILRGS